MLDNWDFWSFLAGLVGGTAITLISIRIKKSLTLSGRGNVVDQSKARANGDIVGRDKGDR